jgi:hypothetical protein
MAFQWKDYRQAVWAAVSAFEAGRKDVIRLLFNTQSNQDEEGFEEAWERLMVDVLLIFEGKEGKASEKIKEKYEFISVICEERVSGEKEDLDAVNLIRKTLMEIDRLRAGTVLESRTMARVKESVKPDWLRMMMKGREDI